ncbi:hypothetical protein [Thiorhodovibrio winogradskyi]|nr:hypothetical protein [Thiorhodovibrio winogradskyi]
MLDDTNRNFRPHRYSTALWDCRVQFDFPMVKLLGYTTPER